MRHTPASPNVMRRAQQIAQHYQAEQHERQQRQEATIAQHKQVQSTSPFSPKFEANNTGSFSYHSPPQTQEHQKSKPSGVYAKPQINLGTSSFKQTGQGKINLCRVCQLSWHSPFLGILSQIAKRINPNKHQQQQNQYESSHNDGVNQKSGNNGEHQEGASKYHDEQQVYTNEGNYF